MGQVLPDSYSMVEALIGFDTTSRNSNLDLIEFISEYLDGLGVKSELTYDDDRRKANLFATLGPEDVPGIVLSGHTDVVPVDGQAWDTDPYKVVINENKLFGRGSTDMKSYIAVCLTHAPDILKRKLRKPIHFAFSYDEEVGCVGVRRLLASLGNRECQPLACFIGEPTGMQAVRAHKGKLSQRCQVHGFECHSGMPDQGVNAVEYAAQAVVFLNRMAKRIRGNGPLDEGYDPPYTTIHTGVIKGGTALNIVPKECWFDFEFRYLPGDDPVKYLQEFQEYVNGSLLPEMRMVASETDIDLHTLSKFPGLSNQESAEVVKLAQHYLGAEGSGKVSFGTEGGLFEQAGIPTVVCGPGSINQAHKPNEFVEIEQIVQCEKYLHNLIDDVAD